MLNTHIVLASASPRRRDLLASLGLDFEVQVPSVDESELDGESPFDLCKRLSLAKAEKIKHNCPDSLIIAADTIVLLDGKVFGKPRDEAHAFEMLSSLSGAKHQVFSGLTVMRGEKCVSEVEITSVYFHELSDNEIRAYIKTGEPADKAGGYAIQGFGSLLVKKIDGDYFNVVGLPLQLLGKILKNLGVGIL